MLGHQPDRLQLAHPALAGAHRHGRVALGQLDRVIALVDREPDVLAGHVLAEAREALAAAGAGDRRGDRHLVGVRVRRSRLEHLQAPARVRVAEAELVRGLEAGQLARSRHRVVADHAGDLAGREHARRQLREREVAAPLVVRGLGAGLQQQRGGRHRATRHQHQVDIERVLVDRKAGVQRADHRRLHTLAPPRLDHRVAGEHRHPGASQLAAELVDLRAQVADGHDLHAQASERRRRSQPAVGRGRDHRAAAGRDRVGLGQPQRSAGQHHAGQVVAGEHQRLLDRAGGEHEPRGANLMQRVALPDRHEPVEAAERRATGDDLDARRSRARGLPTAARPSSASTTSAPARRGRGARRAGRRSRHRRRARRRGGGGTRSATRARAARRGACPARRRCAGSSRTAARTCAGG